MSKIGGKSVVYVLGGPGSGKGTQAKAIAKEYGFGYAAAGDILRAEAETGSEKGKRIKSIIDSGNIVPPELLNSTIQDTISKSPYQYFLMDGFPRTIQQDEAFRNDVGTCVKCFVLEVSDQELERRLLNRAKTSSRQDDNSAVIKERIQNYHSATCPVLDVYEEEGKLVKINGEQSIDAVKKDFVNELHKIWDFDEKPNVTLFEALGERQNRHVLRMLGFMTMLLISVGFGTFFIGRTFLPYIFKNMDPKNAPEFSCMLAVVTTQICIVWFYFYSKKFDEKMEEEEEILIAKRNEIKKAKIE